MDSTKSWLLLSAMAVCVISPTSAVKPSGLACEACHGVVSELHERLSKPATGAYSVRVPRQVDKICSLDNLVKYVFSPPKMVKACNELLGAHKAAIVKTFIRQFDENSKVTLNRMEEEICFSITEACKGVKKSPEDNLRDMIQADHVIKPQENEKIVFERDGDTLIPKTTTENSDPNESSGKKNAKREKSKVKPDNAEAKSKDSKVSSTQKPPKPAPKAPKPDTTKSEGKSATSKNQKTEL